MQSEQDLIRNFVDGDHEAFRTLVEKYQTPLLNYLYRFTGKYEVAEEIVQDTFLVVFQKISTFKLQSSFRAWLYAIATNHASNHLRKHSPIYNNEVLSTASDIQLDPSEKIIEQERAVAVQKALKTLPEKQRAIFILRFYQQFTYEEIAETLKCPIGTVKSRICYTLQKLKGVLSSHQEE
ncbi:RNA polymerase sigma factor [Candidatus Uabimicrobium sp. HlEnr_7]|uniref:RNA polymerase sigma factor n=1 Tax=Candidatus Uabimicrobium helgolandensis TaxID=3095367 RepID=UPI003555C22D